MSEEYEWIARKSINFFGLTILAVSRKPGLTYLTVAHTSSAAARLQLFPFKPGFLFVLGDLIDRSPTRHIREYIPAVYIRMQCRG